MDSFIHLYYQSNVIVVNLYTLNWLLVFFDVSGPAAGKEGGAVELGWSYSAGKEARTMSKSREQSTQWTVCAFWNRMFLHRRNVLKCLGWSRCQFGSFRFQTTKSCDVTVLKWNWSLLHVSVLPCSHCVSNSCFPKLHPSRLSNLENVISKSDYRSVNKIFPSYNYIFICYLLELQSRTTSYGKQTSSCICSANFGTHYRRPFETLQFQCMFESWIVSPSLP